MNGLAIFPCAMSAGGMAGAAADQSAQRSTSGLKPKDRLLRHGAAGLTDTELIAVLLRYPSVEDVAVGLLPTIGGLWELFCAERVALVRSGASAGRAAVLMAAGELMRRLAAAKISHRRLLDQPAVVAEFLALDSNYEQEVLGVLLLDMRHRLIAKCEIFRGTAHRSPATPAPILRAAIRHSASSLIAFHNHPRGDPSPSANDLSFTRQLAGAGKLLAIPLVDHLILGECGSWVSLARHNAY